MTKRKKVTLSGKKQAGEMNGLPIYRFKVRTLVEGAAAPYNAEIRKMTDHARDGLASSVEEFGLVQPIIWNRRTGNIVGGHQRLMTLSLDEQTDVVVVDLDGEREKALNLSLNNRHIGGEWTADLNDILQMITDPALEDLNLKDLAMDVPLTTGIPGSDAPIITADKLEWIPLESLAPHPRNYHDHPPEQLEHLMESIRQNGFYRNIVATVSGTILAGHGVATAARQLGIQRVPVIRVDLDPEDPRALKILAADNEISRMCESDDRALSEILLEIKDIDIAGLKGTGFDEQMLANLVFVTRPADEIKDLNAAAEWVGMPEYHESYNEAIKMTVNFRNEDDRAAFAKKLKLTITDKTRSVWYPAMAKLKGGRTAVKFEG